MAKEKVGDLVGGFELERQLGTGGLTTIWLARTSHGRAPRRRAVVKVMHEHLAASKQPREQFLEEGRLAQRLDHPNIVKVLDVGVEEDRCFLSMEHVDGVDLQTALDLDGAPLPPELAAALVADACRGLDYAHQQGVVHRDVAPDNLMVDVCGRVVVLDFGIGRAQGFRGGDPAHDVLAMGRTLEALVTCRGAANDSEDTQPAGVPLHDLPAALSQVLARATAHAPQQRFGSAAELEAALRDTLRASPPPPAEAIGLKVARWKQRLAEARAAEAGPPRAQPEEAAAPELEEEWNTDWEVDTDPQREAPLPSVVLAPDLEEVAERHHDPTKKKLPGSGG